MKDTNEPVLIEGKPAMLANYALASHFHDAIEHHGAGMLIVTPAAKPVLLEALAFFRDYLAEQIREQLQSEESGDANP